MDRDRRLAEMTREIPLNNGMVAIVDAIDYDFVSTRRWHAAKKGYTYYAVTNNSGPGPAVIYMHQLIMPVKKPLEIDHANGNALDNRWSNLRACTRRQNKMNNRTHKKRSSTPSIYKGVYRHKNKWQARIQLNGESYHLGSFALESDAALAYNKKAVELHGEFARLNEI